MTLLDYVTSIPYAFYHTILVRMPGPGMNIKKIVGEKNEMEKYGMKKRRTALADDSFLSVMRVHIPLL